jgi:formylglycine-generating enzyme required for sulfatase activity
MTSKHFFRSFCGKLEKQSGAAKVHLSLPTEAQWECACRTGANSRFYFGDDENELEQFAWYRKIDGIDKVNGTHPVGEKTPNTFGPFDMRGNVYDWCQDWYVGYYADSPKADPPGREKGEFLKSAGSVTRVLRGGSWLYFPKVCRSARRYSAAPDNRMYIIGFRVVLGPSPRTPTTD